MPHLNRSRSGQPVWLLPFVFLTVGVFSLLPFGRLLFAAWRGLSGGGSASILLDSQTWIATRNTLVVSAGGTLLSVLLGSVFALALTLSDVRGKLFLSFAFMLPLMIPPQVTALSWIQMSGPSSPLLKMLGLAPRLGSPQPLYSLGGIALLLGVQHAPLVYLALRAGLSALPRDQIEAARLSGATGIRVMRDIVVPLAMPGLIAGSAIAFVSAVGNFGIPVVLGIPNSIFVLPTLIYSRLVGYGTSVFGDLALLSIIVALIALIGILVQQAALRHRSYRLIGAGGTPARFALGPWRLPLEALLWIVIAVILVAPLLALVVSSLVPTYGVVLTFKTATVSAYTDVLLRQSTTASAFSNSLFLAGACALGLLLFTVPLGIWLRGRRTVFSMTVEALADVPYALPGIVVGVAFVLLFAAPIPLLGISIYGTLWIILAAYLARFLSLGLKPVASAVAQMDPALEEAARLAGAGFMRRLVGIVLPAIAPAAGAAVILVFLIAVNELTVSALLWAAGTQTLGVMVYNLDDAGNINLAAALSVLIVLMVLITMIALELIATRLPKGVVPWRD